MPPPFLHFSRFSFSAPPRAGTLRRASRAVTVHSRITDFAGLPFCAPLDCYTLRSRLRFYSRIFCHSARSAVYSTIPTVLVPRLPLRSRVATAAPLRHGSHGVSSNYRLSMRFCLAACTWNGTRTHALLSPHTALGSLIKHSRTHAQEQFLHYFHQAWVQRFGFRTACTAWLFSPRGFLLEPRI